MSVSIKNIAVDATPSINDIRAIRRYSSNLLIEISEISDTHFFEFLYFSGGRGRRIPNFDNPKIKNTVSKIPGKILMPAWRLLGIPTAEFFLRKKPDLLHFPGGFPYLPSKCEKILSTIHGTAFDSIPQFIQKEIAEKARMEFYRTLKVANYFITVSESNRNEIIQKYDVPPEKIIAVPLGVSQEFQQYDMSSEIKNRILEYYKLPNKPFILFVGALEPHKNIDNIIASYAELPSAIINHYQLLLVGGKEPYCKIYQELAQKKGIGANVSFVNYIQEGSVELAYIYNLSKLLIFPTYYESWASPPLEAMKCGVPVVVSDISSLRESTGGNALFVDPYGVEDISEKIQQALEDEDLYLQLKKNGCKFAEKFTWRLCAEKTLDVYKNFL